MSRVRWWYQRARAWCRTPACSGVTCFELAQDFGVAYDTVRRATALLRERGLIVTVHGRGTYVA